MIEMKPIQFKNGDVNVVVTFFSAAVANTVGRYIFNIQAWLNGMECNLCCVDADKDLYMHYINTPAFDKMTNEEKAEYEALCISISNKVLKANESFVVSNCLFIEDVKQDL